MYVKFDALNRHEPLVMTLCNPGSVFEDGSPTKIIGIYADTSDEELQLKFNSESELSFRLYKIEREGEDDANEYTKLVFDSTEKKRLIFVNEIGYFMITEAEEGMDDDGTYYKDVKADSIEAEMRDRALIFIDDGTYDFDALVGRIVDTVPNWTIGHVDSDVSARHRTFEDVDVEENVLGFLVEDMQDAFECIFLFDPIQRVINVYDQSNYVRTTDILISKNDVILGFEIKEDKDDLYTAIRAVGDDDLNIAAINPIGTNVLYDFTYYIEWMPEELAIKVSNWQDAVSDAEEEYYDLSLQYYDALGSKYTYTEEDAALNAQLTMYKRCRDNIVAECGDHQELVRGEPPKGTEEQVNAMLTKVTEHIKVLLAKYNSAIVDSGGDSIEIDDDVSIEAEVHETLAEIDRLIAETEESIHANEVEKRNSDEEVASLLSQLNLIRDSLSFENNFTDEELAELNSYVYEGTYSDDYVKVTEDMTHSEQFEQMKILYDRAKSTLKKASQPMKEFDIDVENFVFERAFENKTEQLETGCVIDVELHDDEITSLFLSEITVNYEDHKLSLKFGSQFSRFDPKSMFEDVLGNVKKSANTLDYIKDLVYPIKNGDFNVMKNALKTSRTITMDNALASTDQDVVIDVSGYTGRRIMEDGNIDPQQIKITNKNIVLTDDAWDSAKVAIGELFLGDGTTAYGVNAEVLMGDVIIGNQLHILNEDGNDVFQVTDEKLQSQYTRFSGDIDTLTTNYSRIEQTADNITLEVGRIQEDLDRKVETYSQPEAPASSGRVVGDIWIDSDDNNAMYRWDGNGWVSIRDGTIDAAQSTANNAYAMAQTAIQSVDVEYALGTSNTTAPAEDSSAWQTDSPTWEAGKYVWQRTATTANGVTTYSDPVCIQGASGQDGADGKGIDHITEYYAVSSSNTTAPSSGWTTTIQNTTTTNRYLWNYETITYSDNTTEDTLKRVIGTHGESGAASTSYSLIVSDAAIVKAANSSLSPSSITLTAKAQTGSGAVSNYAGRFKIETSTDLSAWTSVYTSSSNESSKTYTVPSGIRGIRCSLYLAGGTTTLLDQQTVPVVSDGVDGQDGTNGTNGVDGEDAYTVILANESHTFAAGTTSALAGSTECSVIAYKGATRVSATIGTISGSPTGMSTSVSSNGTTSAKFTVSVTTSMTTKNGVLTVPITVDGKSFTKNFTYSLAIKGEDGEDGVSVSSVTNYYLATSASSGVSTSTSGWTTTIQSMDATNQYLWNYEVATGSDNSTINTTDPVIIGRYGQDGTDGTNGRGIDHITEYYAVSSSNTTAPSSWQTTLQNTTTTNKYLWNYETVTYTDGTTEDTIKRVIGTHGATGSSSTAYSLIVSDAAIVKSQSGALSPSSIVLTAKSQTGTSAMANYSGRFKIETTTDMSSWTATYTSSANEATKSYTVPTGIKGIRCSLYLAGGTTTLLDQQTVPVVSDGIDGTNGTNGTNGTDGKDAYTVILTNESHTFAAGTSAAIAGSTECQVIAYKGATQVAATIGTISGQPTGMTTSISSNSSTSAKFTVSVTTSMTTRNGVLTVPITVDGKSFSKRFTYSLAIKGEDGDDGVSISSVTNYYLASASGSGVTTSTSGWTTTIQTMTATNQYLWNYEVVKGSDNSTISSTDPVIIGRYGQNGTNGTNGTNGADGRGISSITEYYAVSSSNSTAPTSWSTTMQNTTTTNKYLWNYETITYTDNTTEDSTKRIIGTHGATGTSATSYSLIIDYAAIVKAQNGTLTPDSITLTAKSQTGSGAMSNYSGRFKIETSTDMSAWTATYTSSSNEATKSYTVPTGIKGIRCSLYLAGGTTTLLDQQTIPVVSDGINGTNGAQGYGIVAYVSRTNFTEANWNTYGEIGHNENWSNTSDIRNGCRIGDLFAVVGTATDSGRAHTLIYRSTTDSGTLHGVCIAHTYSEKGADGTDGTNGTNGTDGKDAYTVILTNESHTFAAGTSAAVAGSTECQVIAYKGATQVAATIGTISGAPTGMSTSISSNGSTSAKFTVSVTTSMTTKNGVLTVPITVDGKSFSKRFTYSLAITGSKGDQGVSVSTVTHYYLATSASSGVTRSTSGWTTTIQTMTATNQYLWAYEVVTGSNNSTLNTTDPVIIGRYGQNGTNGTDGISPTKFTEQYYLSTSSTSQSGGSWVETQPTWESGKYIWTRTKVSWSNNTTTYTDPVLAQAVNNASNVANRADIMARARRGVALFNDPDFSSGLNGCVVYNNSNNGNVTVTRVSSPSGTPTKTGYVLKISNTGAASPGIGGFVCSFAQRANAEFVQIYKLLVPTGYTVAWAGNVGGDGRVVTSLTSMAGTGKWEEYAFYVKCGSSGSFSSAGHIYLSGTAGTTSSPVTWYCCSCQVYDISQTFNPNSAATTVEEQWAYGTASAAQSSSWSSSKVTPTDTYKYLWKRIKTTTAGGTVVYKPSENGVLSSEDSRARALIDATVDTITLGVVNSESSATIQMSMQDTSGETQTSNVATISMTGLVTLSSLESYSVGSRNMLKNSNRAISNANYNIATYYLDSVPIVDDWYTFTLRGTLASSKTKWMIYNSGGSVKLGEVTPTIKGSAFTCHVTFQWKNTSGSTTVTPTYVSLYAANNGQSGTSSIEWVTLTKGKNPSETWELCPSDLSGQNSTTTINGGNITTHTIDANRMNVSTLSSITANIGEVTAGLVRSNDGTTFFDLDNATLKTYSENTTPAFPWADLTFGYETQISNGVVTCHTGQYQSSNQFSYIASSYLSAQGLTIAGYPSDEAFQEANYRSDSQTIYSGSGEALGRSYGARVASYDMTLITHGGESSLNPYRVDAILGNAANAVMDHVRVAKQNWGTSLSVIVGAEATHGILMIGSGYFGFWWVAGNSGSMNINVQRIYGTLSPTVTFTETVNRNAFGRITVSVSSSNTITMFIHTTRKGIMAIAGGYMI